MSKLNKATISAVLLIGGAAAGILGDVYLRGQPGAAPAAQAAQIPLLPPPVIDQSPPAVKKKAVAIAPVNKDVPVRKSSQVADIPAEANGIRLTTAQTEVLASQRLVQVSAETEGEPIWLVFNKADQPINWFELPNSKAIMIVPTVDVDDQINVYAWSGLDKGLGTQPVRLTINVKARDEAKKPESKEPKDPTPVDPTPKKAGISNFTIITDAKLGSANQAFAQLISSRELKTGLANRGAKLWTLDQNADVESIKAKEFDDYVRKVGKVPMYIAQDDEGVVLDFGPLPNTLISILAKADQNSQEALKNK